MKLSDFRMTGHTNVPIFEHRDFAEVTVTEEVRTIPFKSERRRISRLNYGPWFFVDTGQPAGIQAECLSKAWEAQQHMPRERRDQGDDLVRALAAAIVVTRDPGKAWAWFHEQPLSPFGGKTAAQLVEEGRAQDVIDYIESMSAGFGG